MRRAYGTPRPLIAAFTASILIQALNVGSGVILARGLGPYDRGELAGVVLWPSLLMSVGCLGLPDAVTFVTARVSSERERVWGTLLALGAALSLPLMFLAVFVVDLTLREYSDLARSAGLLYIVFIPLSLLTTVQMAALNGLGRYIEFNALRVLVILLSALGVVALFADGRLGIATATIVYTLANLCTLAASTLVLARRINSRPGWSRSAASRMLSFGLRSHAGAVSAIAMERLDQAFVSVLLTVTELGYFVVALAPLALLNLIGHSIVIVAMPALARLSSSEHPSAVKTLLVFSPLGLSMVAGLLWIGVEPLLIALFGAPFAPAVSTARLLVIAGLFLNFKRIASYALRGVGRPGLAAYAEATSLCAAVVSLAVFIPRFGLPGAALADAIAAITGCVLMVVMLARTQGLNPRWLVSRAQLLRMLRIGGRDVRST